MIISIEKTKATLTHKTISAFIAFSFLLTLILPPAYAQAILGLPQPGTMVALSQAHLPCIMQGVTVYYDNPFQFDFIMDTGDDQLDSPEQIKEESRRLIKYFMAALTIPEDDLWVNLSPYEENNVIADSFSQTEMGRDMLAQDYLLKQLSSSLIYPEEELGSKFWKQAYQKAYEKYGTTEIPLNTFNKVWIVPETAVVYEHGVEPSEQNPSYGRTAFVVESKLKVLMEEDYLAMKSNQQNTDLGTDRVEDGNVAAISSLTSEIYREIILPEIEREVNEGTTFANLRQIFNSMLLAIWYKQNLKESILGQVYADQNKINGVDIEDKQAKQKIYAQYIEALNKGVFNYIKEDYNEYAQEPIPRKYFSGGLNFAKWARENLRTTGDLRNPAHLETIRREGWDKKFQVVVSLAGLSPQEMEKVDVQELQDETIDALLEFARDTNVKWINAFKITNDLSGVPENVKANLKKQIEGIMALSGKMKAGDQRVGKIVREELERLLKGENGRELYYIEIKDHGALEKALGLKSGTLPRGHASDKYGINLFDANALAHELGADMGLSDLENIAIEVMVEEYSRPGASSLSVPELIRQYRVYNDEYMRKAEEAGYSTNRIPPQQKTWDSILQKIEQNFPDGQRKENLLRGLGNARDIAKANPKELMSSYLVPDAEEKVAGTKRTVSFRDGFYSLTSRLMQKPGQTFTRHVFQGHGITDLVIEEEGNQINRPWKDVLYSMDTDFIQEGPEAGRYYKEGRLPNNSYNERMDPDEIREKVADYSSVGWKKQHVGDYKEALEALQYLRQRGATIPEVTDIYIFQTSNITFGITLTQKDGKNVIAIERGFLDRIEKTRGLYGTNYNMLTRSFIYLLFDGTHEQARVAEYEWAKERFPGLSEKLPVNVERVLQGMVIENLEPERPENRYDRNEIIRKCKAALWEIGVHMMNQDIQPGRVQWDEHIKNFVFPPTGNPGIDREHIRVGFYPGKNDPLHFGHIESGLRFMASRKLSMMSFANQRFDFRKAERGLLGTFNERLEFSEALADLSQGLVISPVSILIDDDGESNYLYMIPGIKNEVRGRKIELHYLAGGDHAHVLSPDYEGYKKRELLPEGSMKPVIDILEDGSERDRPDVIRNILDMLANKDLKDYMDLQGQDDLASFAAVHGIELVVNFNIRELYEVFPLTTEVDDLMVQMATGFVRFLPGVNLPGIYSTKMRDTFSGRGQFPLAFIPNSVRDYITSNAKYQGLMTELHNGIGRLADNEYAEGQDSTRAYDIQHFRSWLDHFGISSAQAISDLLTPQDIPSVDNLELAPWKKARPTAEMQKFGATRHLLALKPGTVQQALNVIEEERGKRIGQETMVRTTTAEGKEIKFHPAIPELLAKTIFDKKLKPDDEYRLAFLTTRDLGENIDAVMLGEVHISDRTEKVLVLNKNKIDELYWGERDLDVVYLKRSMGALKEEDWRTLSDVIANDADSLALSHQMQSQTLSTQKEIKRHPEISEDFAHLVFFVQLSDEDRGELNFLDVADLSEDTDAVMVGDGPGKVLVLNRSKLSEWAELGRGFSLVYVDRKSVRELSRADWKTLLEQEQDTRPDALISPRPGGIDFNPALFSLEVRRDDKGVPLPLPEQPIYNLNVNGFVPVIIDVIPIPNLNMLLGGTIYIPADDKLTKR